MNFFFTERRRQNQRRLQPGSRDPAREDAEILPPEESADERVKEGSEGSRNNFGRTNLIGKPLTDLGGTSQSLPHKHSVFSISKHLLHLHIPHLFSSFLFLFFCFPLLMCSVVRSSELCPFDSKKTLANSKIESNLFKQKGIFLFYWTTSVWKRNLVFYLLFSVSLSSLSFFFKLFNTGIICLENKVWRKIQTNCPYFV